MTEIPRTRWRLTLRLRSPLQIGAGTLGMVEKTELFIPGRVLWGALTSTIAQLYAPRPVRPDHFIAVGEQLGEDGVRFGTLFPATGVDDAPWRPRYRDEEPTRRWFRGDESQSEQALRKCLIISHTSTPYDPLQGNYDLINTGRCLGESPVREEDDPGMLHATDLIAPRHRIGNAIHATRFTGFLDLPQALDLGGNRLPIDEALIRRVASVMRLGGGRRRGWGEVALAALQPAEGPLHQELLPEGGQWILAPDHEVRREHEGTRGRAVLAVYRKYDNQNKRGYGQASTQAKLCWEVGSVLPG